MGMLNAAGIFYFLYLSGRKVKIWWTLLAAYTIGLAMAIPIYIADRIVDLPGLGIEYLLALTIPAPFLAFACCLPITFIAAMIRLASRPPPRKGPPPIPGHTNPTKTPPPIPG